MFHSSRTRRKSEKFHSTWTSFYPDFISHRYSVVRKPSQSEINKKIIFSIQIFFLKKPSDSIQMFFFRKYNSSNSFLFFALLTVILLDTSLLVARSFDARISTSSSCSGCIENILFCIFFHCSRCMASFFIVICVSIYLCEYVHILSLIHIRIII